MDIFELSATLGLNTSGFTAGLGAAGAALADFLADTIDVGNEFDKKMSAVQAVLGKTEGTIENMLVLRSNALEQAKDSIFTAEQTADAYYYMGMAGWKTQQMIDGLPGIINLAAASGEDLAKVSDIVTDNLTAFGKSADYSTRFADILAATATNANTDVKRMGETFKYIAPIAGSLGYAVEDVALSIGLLANQGIKGSMAGTTLRNIFTRIATNAGATEKDLGALEIITDRLGVDFYDAEGKARPWIAALRDMRKAWAGISEEDRDSLLLSYSDADAKETLSNFKKAATLVETYGKSFQSIKSGEGALEYRAKINSLYNEWEPLLQMLGTEGGDTLSNVDAFQQALIRLGEMTDEQKIYFSKQIGSLRGMPGFLALMEATDEDFDKLYNSIVDSTGAAQEMADVRLDNLWGDLEMFNSRLNIMKIAIYDEIKGPLRELVQFGTSALESITDAITSEGLEGGIREVGNQIDRAAEYLTPILESVGKTLAPVVTSLVTTVFSQLDPTHEGGFGKILIDFGMNIGGAIINGAIEGLESSENPFAQAVVRVIDAVKENGVVGGIKEIISLVDDAAKELEPLFVSIGEAITPIVSTIFETLFKMDSSGEPAGTGIVKILYDIGVNIGGGILDGIVEGMTRSNNPTAKWVLSLLGLDTNNTGSAGGIGSFGQIIGFSGQPYSPSNEPREYSTPTGLGLELDSLTIEDAALTEEAEAGLENDLAAATGSENISNSLNDALTQAGSDAANNIVNEIASELESTEFYIDIQPEVSAPSYSRGRSFAQGMSGGRILRGSTIFGVGEDGRPLTGGESGPEAVVGVNSLNQMIQNSVSSAVGAMLSRMDAMVERVSNYSPAIYLDTGALVGGLAPGMNNELNSIAAWRGYGRA